MKQDLQSLSQHITMHDINSLIGIGLDNELSRMAWQAII